MITATACRKVSAKEASLWPTAVQEMIGNTELRQFLIQRLAEPPHTNANLLCIGPPGTGKTDTLLTYLRQQFQNPQLAWEDGIFEEPTAPKDIERSRKDYRYWQVRNPGRQYWFIDINGATDSPAAIQKKVDDVMWTSADHAFVLVDEIGELYFRNLEESLRPMLTLPNVTTYATAQNFHSKRRTDSRQEDDERLASLLRRFIHKFSTENPQPDELMRFLIKRIRDWSLTIDHPETLRLIVKKSRCVVGYALRPLIRCIDEHDRRVTGDFVERCDVDPLG